MNDKYTTKDVLKRFIFHERAISFSIYFNFYTTSTFELYKCTLRNSTVRTNI